MKIKLLIINYYDHSFIIYIVMIFIMKIIMDMVIAIECLFVMEGIELLFMVIALVGFIQYGFVI